MTKRIAVIALSLLLFISSCAQPDATPAPPSAASTATAVSGAQTPTAAPASVEAGDDVLARFEDQLEDLRQQLKIPAFSAAIVKDQKLVWAKGFGYADLENRVEATPDTPYRLASVTKPIAATLIMQLVEEGKLDLDDPVAKYGILLESDGVVRVWHLLTHTSEGVPGTVHNYSGDRYALLGAVIEGVTGKSFGELLRERILEPLDMANTAPNYPACAVADLAGAPDSYGPSTNDARINRELAKPYQLDTSYDVVAGAYPSGFNPAAGLTSSVLDLAKFDIALDQGVLLGDKARNQMFAPQVPTCENRTDLMYGLGWYSQNYQGIRLLWHSGRWPPSASALYLKAPDQGLTFIILANTTYLTTPFPLGDGDVLYSTLAETFYKTFVFPQQFQRIVPGVDWQSDPRILVDQLRLVTDEDVRQVLERELWSYRQMYASVGRTKLADRLQGVHTQAFGPSGTSRLDLYSVRGVEYVAVTKPQVELSEAELRRFVGEYELTESPQAEGGALPVAVSIEVNGGKLFGVASDMGCISLIAMTGTRFAIPENPGLFVEFHAGGDRIERLTVEAGEMAAVYRPVD